MAELIEGMRRKSLEHALHELARINTVLRAQVAAADTLSDHCFEHGECILCDWIVGSADPHDAEHCPVAAYLATRTGSTP